MIFSSSNSITLAASVYVIIFSVHQYCEFFLITRDLDLVRQLKSPCFRVMIVMKIIIKILIKSITGFRIQDSGFLYFQHNIITNKQYILTKIIHEVPIICAMFRATVPKTQNNRTHTEMTEQSMWDISYTLNKNAKNRWNKKYSIFFAGSV